MLIIVWLSGCKAHPYVYQQQQHSQQQMHITTFSSYIHQKSQPRLDWQGVRALLDTGLDSMYLKHCVQQACDDDFLYYNTRCHLACHVLQRHDNEGLRTCSSCGTSARECHHARNCHQRSERQPMLQISHREVVQVMA